MEVKNEKKAPSVERRHIEAPKNLMEVVSILTEAIKSLGYKEKWHILNLPRAIASAVLDTVLSNFIYISIYVSTSL